MTPEQWSALTGKLTTLETFVIALAKTMPDQRNLQSAVETEKEIRTTALLHSGQSDEHVNSVIERIGALRHAIWGSP